MRHDETVDSIWDDLGCGFEVPWKLRCFAYAVRAVRLTPQERLLKFYGTRAKRAAEASQTVSSACFLSFSPNCCKTKSLCSYQISVTLCFFESLTCFKTAVWNKWKLKMKLGRYTIHKWFIFLI